MSRFLAWVQRFAVALGGPGLFLIAFLDSSFLSFPEVTDVLIILLVMEHPERLVWYAALPTIGSVIGSYVIYRLARRGGEGFLKKRVSEKHAARALSIFEKYGFLAVAIPAILPPPVPFKLFVLAAGAAGMRAGPFLIAATAGRGVRYFGEALLALWYGQRALDFMTSHAHTISIGLVVAVVVLGAGWFFWSRRPGRIDPSAGSSV
ncbi:MAG TPA: VTT domain-containing protein [Vicinamibacterales bacterium]|nr:VTT domain-containing protein [Vicinamibacterales bacterium]